jgi:hypothetical protein
LTPARLALSRARDVQLGRVRRTYNRLMLARLPAVGLWAFLTPVAIYVVVGGIVSEPFLRWPIAAVVIGNVAGIAAVGVYLAYWRRRWRREHK